MKQPFPKYAFFNNELYVSVKTIEPVPTTGRDAAIVCRRASGNAAEAEERYVEQRLWLEAASAVNETARSRGLVTSQSPAHEKIALFRSLFKGRPDVHAHGFRRKDGGIGYVPACENEWKRGVCPRVENAHTKCSLCEKQAFAPLTDSTIISHFKGLDDRFRDVFGLYVLNEDSTTSLLVMDFDEGEWQDAARAVREAAKSHGLQASVERSRSGNGCHIWFFFECPVSAKLARDFGSALISEAMAHAKSVGFDAYDRMLPAQTTIPEGGFGNLIAAPFQGRAQRHGNSVFVDEQLRPYPDQWLFLSKVGKLSEEAARAVVDSHAGAPLGSLQDEHGVPWKGRAEKPLSRESFTGFLDIVESDMIYVPESALSAEAANAVKRAAAFANPDFFRAQAMHQSVYGKQRVICLGEEREGFIALPRGCKRRLLKILSDAGASFRLHDERYAGPAISAQFKGLLRPEQEKAAERMLEHDDGILSAPTGFGKTVIGAYLISRLRLPTLVIVPRCALVSQWAEKLSEFLSVEHPDGPLLTPSGKPSKRKRLVVGQIGAGKKKISGIIDIATSQALIEKDPDTGEPHAKRIVKSYGLVICDECHHAAASHLEMILKATPARRIFGLSATPKRSDGLDCALYMLCGPIRCTIDPKEQAAQQGFKRILRPVFTRIRVPGCGDGASYNQILDKLCANEARNRLIATDVVEVARRGGTPLVLTKRKEHARRLARLISGEGRTVHLLIGEGTAAARRKLIAEATREEAEGPSIIVATEGYLGEGFDFSKLDALFLTTPISWDGNVTQQAGRLHRTHEGKNQVTIWDYVDSSVPMLERMHKKRLKTYAKLGYEVELAQPGREEERAEFVTAGDAVRMLAEDIRAASSSVAIVALRASRKTIELLGASLSDAIARGLRVSCTLAGSPAPEIAGVLEKMGATVHAAASTAHAGLAVFDEETVWYGTLPLLAFPRKDDCSIRFKSPEAAHDLLQETRLDEQGRQSPGEGDIPGEESPRRGGRKAASGGSQGDGAVK